MKTIFALMMLVFSTAASSACYMIFGPANELVWRGTAPPVKMDSVSLGDEVRKIVPNGHLVISSEPFASCPSLDSVAPRTAMRQTRDDKNDGKDVSSARQ